MVAGAWLVVPLLAERSSIQRFVVPISVGVAMAYVFVDIFPHLVSLQRRLGSEISQALLSQYLYSLMLAGFCFHLGVKLFADTVPLQGGPGAARRRAISRSISMSSLFLYAFLIGSMLSEQGDKRASGGALYAIAMTLHVLGLGGTLQHNYSLGYGRAVRWSLAGGVVLGWLAEQFVGIGPFYNASLYALIGGQIIVIAAVFELPRLRDLTDLSFFLIGTVVFAALIEGTRILLV
jgi:hypothetical protein